MYAPDRFSRSDDSHDPHAHAGDDIAPDRRGRIVRRFVYSGLALAAAGLVTLLNGCADEIEDLATPTVSPAETTDARTGDAEPAATASFVPLPAPLDGFALFPADGSITFKPSPEGVTLDGRGYFASTREYGPDFTVAYEYRFPRVEATADEACPKCNTGCLLFIGPEDRVWPRCLEVQGKWTETGVIKSNAPGVTPVGRGDGAARDAARKPPGEWNRVEVVSVGGGLTVTLNGVEVSMCEPTELDRGRIGFQAEGVPAEFRNVTIEE